MTTNTDDDNIEIIGANPQAATDEDADGKSLTDLVEQPAKVMRIGSMIKQLLEEVRAAPLDDASRNRCGTSTSSISELKDGLAPSCARSWSGSRCPSPRTRPVRGELRIAQAQLVGWLEGLFHGIQTALFAQQMAARAQLEQMRHSTARRRGARTAGRRPRNRQYLEEL